jgi:hypothetical protein
MGAGGVCGGHLDHRVVRRRAAPGAMLAAQFCRRRPRVLAAGGCVPRIAETQAYVKKINSLVVEWVGHAFAVGVGQESARRLLTQRT